MGERRRRGRRERKRRGGDREREEEGKLPVFGASIVAVRGFFFLMTFCAPDGIAGEDTCAATGVSAFSIER